MINAADWCNGSTAGFEPAGAGSIPAFATNEGVNQMGTGTTSGRFTLTAEEKANITNGIMTHTSEQNDGAMRTIKNHIDQEQKVIDNYDSYVKLGYITGKGDPWWKGHENTLATLEAQYKFFEQERKRIGK